MWRDDDRILAVLDNACEGEIKYPHKCPVCNCPSAHIYIHGHDNKHSGIWIWCSSCNSYAHTSDKTPEWWKNPDFIDESQLCAEPEYLDKIAGDIDEWVNNTIPAGHTVAREPITVADEFKIRLIEEYQGIPAGTTGKLVIKDNFKTMTFDFITTDGEIINLTIQPEKVTEIFEVTE